MLEARVETHRQTLGIIIGLTDDAGHRVIAYGVRTKDDSRPLDDQAVFEIGSITKVFTSLLLTDAVRRGEVALTDPIEKHLPAGTAVPRRNGQSITLLDLATHTSGLPRLPANLSPRDALNPYADYTVEQLYQFLGTVTVTRDIGSQYEYSNLGAGLLGQLLARRAGTDYETLVRTRITAPLSMTSTAISLDEGLRRRLVPGHDATQAPTPNWDLPALAGAGALRSTVHDMLTFLDAASGRTSTPLSSAFSATLATRRPTGSAGLEMALGWHVIGSGEQQIVWHNGGTGGYRSWIGYDPKTRRGVVALTNTFSTAGPDDIGRHLLMALPLLQTFPASPAPPKPRVETRLAPAAFDRYVGRYQLAPSMVLTVSRNEERFFVEVTGQPPTQIYAESDRSFFVKIVDAQLTFETDAGGTAVAVVLHQNGMNQRAPRITGEPIMPKEIALDPAVFDRHIGRYQFAAGVEIAVRREGTRFLAQITNQPPAEIFAESPTRFFYKIVTAALAFEPGPNGQSAAVVLHQNGLEQRAARVPLPKEIALDAAVLDRYVGRYQLGPSMVMTIARAGTMLTAQPTGQAAKPIHPSSATEFYLKDVEATIVFEVDGAGKVLALTLSQAGRQQRAPRVD